MFLDDEIYLELYWFCYRREKVEKRKYLPTNDWHGGGKLLTYDSQKAKKNGPWTKYASLVSQLTASVPRPYFLKFPVLPKIAPAKDCALDVRVCEERFICRALDIYSETLISPLRLPNIVYEITH